MVSPLQVIKHEKDRLRFGCQGEKPNDGGEEQIPLRV